MLKRCLYGLIVILFLAAGHAEGGTSHTFSPAMKELVGKTVIFLSLGHEGGLVPYVNLRKEFGAAAKSFDSVELAGKKARIVEFKKAEGSEFPVRFYLRLEREGGGTVWYVDQGTGEYLKEMVLEDHLDTARKWVGKTAWVRIGALLNVFRSSPLKPVNENESDSMLKLKNTEKLSLTHVELTTSGMLPFLFKVKRDDGTEGYLATRGSVDDDLRQRFYVEDPREGRNWPGEVWRLVEEGRVQIGMSEEQVTMAWGEADRIGRNEKAPDTTEWIYDRQKLCFEKGKVVSMGEEPPAGAGGKKGKP